MALGPPVSVSAPCGYLPQSPLRSCASPPSSGCSSSSSSSAARVLTCAFASAGARKVWVWAFGVRRLRSHQRHSRRRQGVLRRSKLKVEVAEAQDVPPAAEIAVRCLRWTKNWWEKPSFSDNDYALLTSNETQAYSKLYFRRQPPESVLLVAKAEEGEPEAAREAQASPLSGLFGSSGSSSSRSRVVGCVGCEVKCFNRFTGEEQKASAFLNGDETVLRPVMADLAVASDFRGRGIAKKLISRLEETVQSWGYEELILFVEATNFGARNLYARLGYRLGAIKPDVETSYLETNDGPSQLAPRRTVAFLLRKSLRPFPLGALENINWGFLAAFSAVAYLAWDALPRSGDVQTQLAAVQNMLSTLF